jgi:ABC-2 type transport system ATP-binding protein
MHAVEVKNVTMCFNKSKEKIDSLKEYCIKFLKRQLFFESFKALDDVSVSIKKGEVFGIVGLNGSGKSTLLKIISGILKPTSGSIVTDGSIAPLVELGAGFDIDLTARENIYLNGSVLGYGKKYIDEKFNEIVDFAEIWDFIDVPIKNFSSGMIARVGFAIATITCPDILIVDEILGVGDYKFQEKCEQRINEIIKNGATVIIVSHTINQIKRLCNRVMWIEKGKVKMIGNTKEVCECYQPSDIKKE